MDTVGDTDELLSGFDRLLEINKSASCLCHLRLLVLSCDLKSILIPSLLGLVRIGFSNHLQLSTMIVDCVGEISTVGLRGMEELIYVGAIGVWSLEWKLENVGD